MKIYSPVQKVLIAALLGLLLTACQPTASTPVLTQYPSGKGALSTVYPVPTDVFSSQDDFGDGYIARVPIADLQGADDETIVKTLVIFWLEHYQNDSRVSNAAIKGYTIDHIRFLDETINPGYQIVAGVRFSIIPAELPSAWASFPGDAIDPNDIWWHDGMPVGVFRDGDYYRMRLVFGWGT